MGSYSQQAVQEKHGLCSDLQPFPLRTKVTVICQQSSPSMGTLEVQPVPYSQLGYLPLSSGPDCWSLMVLESLADPGKAAAVLCLSGFTFLFFVFSEPPALWQHLH